MGYMKTFVTDCTLYIQGVACSSQYLCHLPIQIPVMTVFAQDTVTLCLLLNV